ncbi:hypothetical protein LBMAG53_39170 [Planctomycetota bacterium]|nr:hypothetical protein LBMAG53_39170 [Planctomycetota bacterium]
MHPQLIADLAALPTFSVRELRARFETVFHEPARSFNKAWLARRIAWRLQAQAEGDLSERARRRAAELATDADIRVTPPRASAVPQVDIGHRTTVPVPHLRKSAGMPAPGTLLTRTYKGATIRVAVLADGFDWNGSVYTSLTAVAKAITGSHLSGRAFFGLVREGDAA